MTSTAPTWTKVSSLSKLVPGEVARVPWPGDANPDTGQIPDRYGYLKTIEWSSPPGTPPKTGTSVVFCYVYPQTGASGEIQVTNPGQVEVKRGKGEGSETRSLG